MSSMGKAMMGTGEAEGEDRAMVATEMALNNPLIDEYSLQGAKGLLINITGGKDLTLFEVDQAVNKIRAEVDPEAELIFGAIKDENMNGKIRVSIVATSLDGYKSENNTVLNMVSRIQNRNTGYSDSLFSYNTITDGNNIGSIEGATALKLDQSYEVNEELNTKINYENTLDDQRSENTFVNEEEFNNIPSGVSMESAGYMENTIKDVRTDVNKGSVTSDQIIEEYTPKLFSEEQELKENVDLENNESIGRESEELFDQDINEEEDFEIPAFLRKQKF
jgi:cell division protein FtsZ